MSKGRTYIESQLGSCGYVLCHRVIAYRLGRRFWGTQNDVDVSGPESRKYLASLASQMPLTLFTFEGDGIQGFGAAFNIDRLEERIWQTYGLKLKIAVVESLPEPAPAPDMQKQKSLARWQERLDKLNKLAAQEPLPDCQLGRDILEAREILASPDLLTRERQRFG